MYKNINRERLIRNFCDLVRISSPSWKEEGVMEYIISKLGKLNVNFNKYKCGDSYNLLLRLEGDSSKDPILFSAHMDTVLPCENVKPVVTNTKIMSDGSTILGADDKAAIAVFLEVLYYLEKNRIRHGAVEFLFSCAEEVGLHGIKGMDFSLLNAKYAFVFDSNGPIGKVILKAPYQTTMDIVVKGKSAHAGIAPEKGINAIRIASEIITRIPQGRIDKETTANVGIISGGKATNIVPDEASIALEARSINPDKLKSIEAKIEKTAKAVSKNYKAKIKINKKLEYSGYTIGKNDKITIILNKAFNKIKIRPAFEVSGGGSDTNVLNKGGIKAVNLAIGMREVHTKNEFIEIKDLVNGTRLVLSIIESV